MNPPVVSVTVIVDNDDDVDYVDYDDDGDDDGVEAGR